MPRTIRNRILAAMMSIVVGFLLLGSIQLDLVVTDLLDKELARGIANGHASFRKFSGIRSELLLDRARSMAQVPHLRAALATPDVDRETIQFTAEMLGEASVVPLLVILDEDGRVIADTGPAALSGIDDAHSEDVEAVLHGSEYAGVWRYGGGVYFVAACTVDIGGSVVGALCIGYPLDDAAAHDLHTVTGHGIAFFDGERMLGASWPDKNVSSDELRSAFTTVAGPGEQIEVGGREALAQSVPFGPGVRVVLGRPIDGILTHVRRSELTLFVTAASIAALALVAGLHLSRRITRPIDDLVQASKDLADEDWTKRVAEPDEPEFAILARSFNRMVEHIAALVSDVEEKARGAEAASRAKSEFLAVMSHELRTPLNAIIGYSEILRGSQPPGEQQEFCQSIARAGWDLLAIVQDVLDYSKVEAGGMVVEEARFHLGSAVDGAVESVVPTLLERDLRYSVGYDADVPFELVGDAHKYGRILRNYLANAAKFTERGGVRVTIHLREDSDEGLLIETSVRDTGIGIAPDDLERVFSPFSQADASTTRKFGGTGLGLAICRDLAQLLGGDAGVESEVGRGSRFWFTARFKRAAPTEVRQTA